MTDLPKVVIHNDRTEVFAYKLTMAFPDIEFRECNTYDALPVLISEFQPEIIYSVRFDGTPSFPREAIFGAKWVKWVSNGGAGVDHFGTWDPEQITVTNSAGVAADMMAEYVMGGFLHFTIDVPGLQADQASRIWASRTDQASGFSV